MQEQIKKSSNESRNDYNELLVFSRDKSVWTKTQNEKKLLRNARNSTKKEKMHFHSIPIKNIPVLAKLIIYLKKNTKFPKTTYSTNCYMHEIGNILALYCTDKCENLVVKYSYNGKTYSPNERPFWK